MKNYLVIFCLIYTFFCDAQKDVEFDYDDFENQFLAYKPVKSPTFSDKDYEYGSMIIAETKNAIDNNPKNFNVSDYYNVLSAFLTLKESEENIRLVFEKFKHSKGSCEYILSFKDFISNNKKYDVIRADYLATLKACESPKPSTKSKPEPEMAFDIIEYCKSNDLEMTLVKQMLEVQMDDQRYRKETLRASWDRQQELDKNNQEIIRSLYKEHNRYVGKSLVGEKFEHIMWLVIQHANKEMMAEYLPIVQKAVQEKELSEGPLKMLIDRYYLFEYGYQIFGSQGQDHKLADKVTKHKIKKKYNLN